MKSMIDEINKTIASICFGYIAITAILIFVTNIVFLKQFYVLGIFFMKTLSKDLKLSESKFKFWLTLLTVWICISLIFDYWYWVVNDLLRSMTNHHGGKYAAISMIV